MPFPQFTHGIHYGVGPQDVSDEHEIIVISNVYDTADPGADEGALFVCLDCGLVSDDLRRFRVKEECDRENNPIPKTLREKGGLA